MKYQFIFIALILSIFITNVRGQNPLFFGRQMELTDKSGRLQQIFKKHSVYKIDSESISLYLKEVSREKGFTLQLGDKHSWNLQLEPVIITTPKTKLTLFTEEGKKHELFFSDSAYKGVVDNDENNSEVRLVIDKNFIYGYIEENDKVYYLEPLYNFQKSSPDDHYLVYEDSHVLPNHDHICGVIETSSELFELERTISSGENGRLKGGECKAIGISIAVDFSMYQKYGNSHSKIANQIIGVINNVNGNYNNEFDNEIRFVIGNFFFSTCSNCDPWIGGDLVNARELLTDFRNWGQTGGFCNSNNGLHGLWTMRDLFSLDEEGKENTSTIGMAFQPGVCNNSRSYHVIEDTDYRAASELTNLVTHEIGHNFNCLHNYEIGGNCDDEPNRPPLIMDPRVSVSTTWSDGTKVCALNSINTFNEYSTGLSCLYPCPTTLMDMIWVDFDYNACSQFGTFDNPFNILSFGVYWLQEGGTMIIKSSLSDEILIIDKPCTLDAWSGPVIIGQQ